ncbi:MAG: hypothetical protein KJ823_00195, partial [Proteobacteria bacterium]|nr:hypothetical protein [Pseudomonadota bacterium]
MKALKLTFILTGVMALFSAGSVWAEEKREEVYTLEEIVVTATKTEKLVEDVPGSVTVISDKEME